MTTMRYFKFFQNPDYVEDIDEAGVYDKLMLPKNGGVIEDPKCRKPPKLGTMDRSGLYFTDIPNAWYYMTYGDYVAEVFPINGVPMKRCHDRDVNTLACGWYAPKIHIGPIKPASLKFLYELIKSGTDLSTVDYHNTYDMFELMMKIIMENQKPKKWPIRICQAILVGVSNLNRDVFNELWDEFFDTLRSIMGQDIYEHMYPIIADKDFDLSARGNGFGLLVDLRIAMENQPMTDDLGKCIHMYLLRLRNEHPAVYATCPDFPTFEEFVQSNVDPDGFTHLHPRYYGPYDQWRVNRRRHNM